MNFNLEDFLKLTENDSEKKEINQYSSLTGKINLQIKLLKNGNNKNFFDELIVQIKSLIYNYVLAEDNADSSPVQRYLFLLYQLYNKLSDLTFLNDKYLINFLFRRIIPFCNSINPQNFNNIEIINSSIIKSCKVRIEPIITHCLNTIVNKFIYEPNSNNNLEEHIINFFSDNCKFLQISKIQEQLAETLFIQLICLDNFKNPNDKLMNYNDERAVKNFIENIITKYYDINKNNNEHNEQKDLSANDNSYIDKKNEFNISFLFINVFNVSTLLLLRYLRNAILNVFTPVDAVVLDYFEYYINIYINRKSYINKNVKQVDLKILEKIFLENNIQDIDIKIRNLSFLIDIIIQKYFNIQNINEFDLLKFPRINIIINRLFMEKKIFYQDDKKELINAIFEHFIISQFIFNYIKYQIKDPEHYPLEIRYFIIYSYLKISENYLKTNPFSAFITCIALREIIIHLKLEIGFKKQKYIKNVYANNNQNNRKNSSNKNSAKKSKRRKSVSRSKKKKKKEKKKSTRRSDFSNNSKNNNIDIDTSLLDNYIKSENEPKNESKKKSKNNDLLFEEEKLDQPEKMISKALFNYLCFVYSMKIKNNAYSEYFEELYSFIDFYISDNLKSIVLDDEWAWLLIYPFNYIDNFDLKYTFDKFNIKNSMDLDTKIKLISHLSKKIKYCNTQEHLLILDVIYNILTSINDLNSVTKLPKYNQQMKNLNRGLSYLSFNINYSVNFSKMMSFIEQELVAEKIFKITNLLFIESIDEYFWMPKNIQKYKSFIEFISVMEQLFNKILYKQSLYTESSINCSFKIKKYIGKFLSNKSLSKKEKEAEQYILALDYFCKLELPNVNNIHNLKNMSLTKEKIFNLIELLPQEYNLEFDLDEKVDLLSSILLSGEYDLRIIIFLICQIINKGILEENSQEINIINDIFALMINKDYKFMINFILTLYKSLEKYSYDLIDKYVITNFSDNRILYKQDYIKYLNYFDIKNKVDNKDDEGKQIQKIYHNWKIIRQKMEKSGIFYKFLSKAEEMNYPKSVMNLIEKYIFDITREKNIHNFIDTKKQEDKDELKNMAKYLKLYYKAYSHIDDNNIILDNYFNNNQIFSLINSNNNSNNNIFSNNNLYSNPKYESIDINTFINNTNNFLISLDYNILMNNITIIGNIEKEKENNNIYFALCRFLFNIVAINDKKNDLKKRKFLFLMLKNMEQRAILEILSYNNKLYENSNLMNYSLFLYELTIYLEIFENLFIKNAQGEFEDNNQILEKLRTIFIDERKIPYIKRYLLIFQFRRFLFHIYKDYIPELYCLVDICKVYKTIWETGISKVEVNDFRQYLLIIFNNLINIDSKLIQSIDLKLFLNPLKYHVKFFSSENCSSFDSVFEKYKKLCSLIKDENFFSNKIIILNEKRKAKRGVVGLDEQLLIKIKDFGTNRDKKKSNMEGFLLYTDFYLDRLINNDNVFQVIRSDEKINNIQIFDISPEIFDYLEGAINICVITEKEKYLRKYMPEIINLFFKINLAHINYIRDKNEDNNISQTQSQSLSDGKINKYKYLLNKFKKDVSINKIKIIIPQLIICYQYENTYLYSFAIEILAMYAEKNIDLIAYLLSSFLTFKAENLKNLGIKPHRGRNELYEQKYKNFIKIFNRSKDFVLQIKQKLNKENQNILTGYEEFCEKLSNFFYENKRFSSSSKKDFKEKKDILINDINNTLSNYKIILPTIDNLNNCKMGFRNCYNSSNNVLFLKELDSNVEILSSKEKPMHIKFKVTNINGSINPIGKYDFLLKCDVNDITKEIKTFEIIDEINNIFRIKHYDINDSMSLKRYLIVPIAPTIILAEWLLDSLSLSYVIDEQSIKDLIYQDENKSIIGYKNNNPYIIKGSIINENEKFNVLYNYYQYCFFDPNLWYNAKKRYIISTAIWSMTSFLVGLGDRHPGNIMINRITGEVIHIDFGYVALKGLSLGVPEIVDFRLTLNLKKNLGLFEENGLFNYICVKALRTFKEYYKTLSARIEYYQFDPLFDSDSDNQTFTLFRKNDQFFKYLDDNNINVKLKELIEKNTNGENLEKMYVWWSPWI